MRHGFRFVQLLSAFPVCCLNQYIFDGIWNMTEVSRFSFWSFQQCLSPCASSLVLFLGFDSSPDRQSSNRTAIQEGPLPLATPPLRVAVSLVYGKWQVVSDNIHALTDKHIGCAFELLKTRLKETRSCWAVLAVAVYSGKGGHWSASAQTGPGN